MFKTLKNRVQQTEQVAGLKLGTPADRIGQGLAVAANLTDDLSSGRFPLPHDAVPEPARSWPSSEPHLPRQMHEPHLPRQMHEPHLPRQMRSGPDGDAIAPVGSARSSPGSTVVRSATRATAAGSSDRKSARRPASNDRACYPRGLGRPERPGDCRSLGRTGGQAPTPARETGPGADAGT